MSTLQQTLTQLRDIHPGPPPVLPPSNDAFWYLLPLLGAGLLALQLWRCSPLLLAGWQLYRLRTLSLSSHQSDNYIGIAGLNRWLKVTTLLTYPREEIAALHGEHWLTWLAQHSATPWTALQDRWSGWLYADAHCTEQEYRQVWGLCRDWWLRMLWRRLCWH